MKGDDEMMIKKAWRRGDGDARG